MNPEVPKNESGPEGLPAQPVNIGASLAELRLVVRSLKEIKKKGGVTDTQELYGRLNKAINLFQYVAIYGTEEERNEYYELIKPFLYSPNAVATPPPETRETQEEDEMLDLHKVRHPEQFIIPETLREAGPEIAKFEAMVAAFEIAHPLAELEAIVDLSPDLVTVFKYANDIASDEQVAKTVAEFEKYNPPYVKTYQEIVAKARAIVLTPEEKRNFEIRRAAQADMIPIVALFNTLKKETNISTEKHGELGKKLTQLTRAIGSINKLIDPNRITH